MQRLGHTRSAFRRDHLLLTPDTFVRAPLPGMRDATAIVHVGPAAGASFTQYTAEFAQEGTLGEAAGERFLYVLEGSIGVGAQTLEPGGYAYIPEGDPTAVRALTPARAALIERWYEPLPDEPVPQLLIGKESDVAPTPLQGDDALQVRTLLPGAPSFDFAVNTMTYLPGATLPMVEIHVMEHGLLMLEGGGIYRLGDSWYPVTAGDFIWMGPYCPQWFGALGKTPAKYLIYKDWNRHPLA
jgi:(S)-ureidoglycine aminohydrolase